MAPTTAWPPRRRGATRRRTVLSKATAPAWSPISSATRTTATAASSAASSLVSGTPEPGVALTGAAISRPESMQQITLRSCSTRYWLLIGRAGLADPGRGPAGVDVDDEFGRHPPGQDQGHRPLQPGRPPDGHGVAGRPGQQPEDDEGRQRRRQEEKAEGGGGQEHCEPGRRTHGAAGRVAQRGTGTEARAAVMASSGR